jgi:hypothetical protein
LIGISQPGIYGVNAEKPLNTLLVDVDPQERWNVVYQQAPAVPMVSGIQFNSNLHAYVTQPEASLIIPSYGYFWLTMRLLKQQLLAQPQLL